MAKITENNLGNYSTFTTDKGYKLDEFVEFTDIQADEYPLIDELQDLLRKPNKTPEELTRMNELNTKFADKIPTAWDWNKFCSCLISMEKFILVEINGYIALMKKDLKEYTDARKVEIETLIGQMDYKELWNKDVLYKRFNQVKHNGNVYTARKDNLGQIPNPIQDTEYWYITSMKGDTGIQGERGYDGINLVYKEDYNDNEAYNKNNVVSYNGRLYVCVVDGTKGLLPTNLSNWKLGVDRGQSMILKTGKSTVNLKEDSNVVPIEIPQFNSKEDTLLVHYQGSYLEEHEEYEISTDGLTIERTDGELWKKGSTFNYLIFKNVTAGVPSADPSLMPDKSINKNKLNPTILQEIDDKIVILNGEGELKEKVNKSDFDVYKGEYNTYKSEVKSSLDDKVSKLDFDKLGEFKNICTLLNAKFDLNTLDKNGNYMGVDLVNAPSSEWFYIKNLKHATTHSYQKAIPVAPTFINSKATYERWKEGGVWTPWFSLFQSVSSMKAKIASATTDMGVPTDATATGDTMAGNIRKIFTGKKFAKGLFNKPYQINGLDFKPNLIAFYVKNFKPGYISDYALYISSELAYLVNRDSINVYFDSSPFFGKITVLDDGFKVVDARTDSECGWVAIG